MKTYLVGGAVRDKLLGLESNDHDYVVVGSTQEEMLSVGFSKVGAAFPVFIHPETGDEYALARREKKTGKGYLGFECEFSTDVTLEEDLLRRDLTINSMAMDSDGNLIDPSDGYYDLHTGILRHTSDAFIEDPVRILRLARFYARYSNFRIAPETLSLCNSIASTLNEIPPERFWREIEKVIIERDEHTLRRFCEALDTLGVFENSEFFEDALPNFEFLQDDYYDLRYVIEDMNVFSAVFSSGGTKTFYSTNAERLSKTLHFHPITNGASMYNAIKSLGGYNSVLIDMFCDVMKSYHKNEESYRFKHGFAVSKLITSEFFPTKSGQELGLAIKDLQIKMMNELFK